MYGFAQRLRDKASWLWVVILGPIGWAARQLFEDAFVTATKSVAGQAGVKAAALVALQFWLERPFLAAFLLTCATVAVAAVASAVQGRGGHRAGAKRLNDLAEHAIHFIVNETNLPPGQLETNLRKFEAEALDALKQEGCSETERSEFRVLGDVEPIQTPGPTDRHRQLQRVALTKAKRLRAAAARLEGLPPRGGSTMVSVTVTPPASKLKPIAARVEVKSTHEASKGENAEITWLVNVVNREDVPLLLTGTFHVVTDRALYDAYRVSLENLPDSHPVQIPARTMQSVLVVITKQFPKGVPAALQHRIKYPDPSERFVRHDLVLNDHQSRRSLTVGYGRPYDEVVPG